VTDRDGVFRFDGFAFEATSLPSTLLDQDISNIVADPHGNLLLAHTAGVDILTNDGQMINFRGTAIELLNPNLNAHFVDSSDAIWIAGQHTILKYNPLKHAGRNAPLSMLTDVRVFVSPVEYATQHTFKATQNYLTFDFIGLWYTDPRNVTYRYKLDGLDPDWNETREHTVTYQSLPPGSYRFELESSSSGQFGNGSTVSYAFEIRKPFYQTAVFILLATSLLFIGIYAALRIREQRINKAAALQRRQIESQLQTLKAQINPHFLFNSFNTLVSVIEEDPGSAVEYVENLSDFYRSILQYREKNLIPLNEEIEIVKTYAYVLHKRYGSALRITIDPMMADIWIVPLVLQILVENAVKHNVISEHRPLTIGIRQHDAHSLIIENTLQKRSVISDSTGFGLQSIISRYALLTRQPVQVGQAEQKFYVIIPVLNSDEISDH
jgi:hypothetical protein